MDTSRSTQFFQVMLGQSPRAYCHVYGGMQYPQLTGIVLFFEALGGSLVFAEFVNLPVTGGNCAQDFFGFHIHEGASCSGTPDNEFANAMGHFNPYNCPHPEHLGDMPPLLGGKDGYAFTVFFTDKFTPRQVAGRTVIVHRNPDDFTTQPSGNSGPMIACGTIF